tara:strand:- start:90 stop:1013 length:924 start_codon:yes stop_codon:yes gene_type:complete
MAQGPTQPQRQSGREGYINSKLSVAFFNSPEAEQQAREQFGKDYDADPSIYQQQPMQTSQPMIDSTGSQRGGMPQFDQLQRPPGTMGPQQRLRNPRPPKAEGLGVSSFVGASSNDMQRMLNRGSISGDNMGDAQRRMEQLRSNEFLAKMRAQNPERFNNPTTSAPPTDPRIFPTPPPPLAGGAPQYPGSVPPGLAEPRQFPFNPFLNKTTPSTAQPSDQGIMGQAPPNLTQYLEMMRSPMQQGGYGGSPAQAPQVNPMQSYGMMGMANPMQAQMSQMPEQIMQQGGYAPMQAPTGSQNSAPIASPFA